MQVVSRKLLENNHLPLNPHPFGSFAGIGVRVFDGEKDHDKLARMARGEARRPT
jgi:hypothetical protein